MPLTNHYKRIPLSQIYVLRDERQRREIDTSDIEGSIKARGVVQPIVVEETSPDHYRLDVGERRFTASQRLGLPDIPCRLAKGLTPTERQIIELEENVKRKSLFWKDEAIAIKRIHDLFLTIDSTWSQTKTASELSIEEGQLSYTLRVAEELLKDNKLVHEANGIRPAYNIISRKEGRLADDVMNDLLAPEQPEPAKEKPPIPVGTVDLLSPVPQKPVSLINLPTPAEQSILCEDFCKWATTYSGPLFSLIHCDFPYGINLDKSEQAQTKSYGGYDDSDKTYKVLCQCLADNLDRLMTQSGHLMFWLSSDIVRQFKTISFFAENAPSLEWRTVPIFWHKTDNRGILPDPKRGPRQVVETALIASRSDRLIIRAVSNAYGSPTTKEVHQSEKPEPMLRHFFQMFVDENTRMLDPTCGSGSSLRAAESLGATHVLGLEINPDFCEGARTQLRRFRNLRALEKK